MDAREIYKTCKVSREKDSLENVVLHIQKKNAMVTPRMPLTVDLFYQRSPGIKLQLKYLFHYFKFKYYQKAVIFW